MFCIVGGLFLAACVVAAPAPTDVVPIEKEQPTVIPIVSQSDEFEPNGTYKFSYETGNGIKREESSYSKVIPKARSADGNDAAESESDEIHVQVGSYSYTAPDGTFISIRYIADENGFQPIGDHIPRVPAFGSSSLAEKSGRALETSDSTSLGSEPVALRSSPAKSEENPEPQKNEGSSASTLSNSSDTQTTQSTEIDANVSKTEPSTTEAAKAESSGSTITTEAAATTTVA